MRQGQALEDWNALKSSTGPGGHGNRNPPSFVLPRPSRQGLGIPRGPFDGSACSAPTQPGTEVGPFDSTFGTLFHSLLALASALCTIHLYRDIPEFRPVLGSSGNRTRLETGPLVYGRGTYPDRSATTGVTVLSRNSVVKAVCKQVSCKRGLRRVGRIGWVTNNQPFPKELPPVLAERTNVESGNSGVSSTEGEREHRERLSSGCGKEIV